MRSSRPSGDRDQVGEVINSTGESSEHRSREAPCGPAGPAARAAACMGVHGLPRSQPYSRAPGRVERSSSGLGEEGLGGLLRLRGRAVQSSLPVLHAPQHSPPELSCASAERAQGMFSGPGASCLA